VQARPHSPAEIPLLKIGDFRLCFPFADITPAPLKISFKADFRL
jgi:hypothetical protein